MASALSVTQAFDFLAIRVNGPRAWEESLSILWRVTDADDTHRTVLANGVLIHCEDPKDPTPDLSLTLTKAQLLVLIATGVLPDAVEQVGDAGALGRLMSVLDTPDAGFPIVTP